MPNGQKTQHIITIQLEEYFQVDAFSQLIDRSQWYRFEGRMREAAQQTLALLKELDTLATFFVMGWNAERDPDLIREIADAGHEIAISGFYHRNVREMSKEEFLFDLRRCRDLIENATGKPVYGYRMPSGWLKPDQLWLLEELSRLGFAYDSSLLPYLHHYRSEPFRRFPHSVDTDSGRIWELPPSTKRIAGLDLPLPGGNYFRQLPHRIGQRFVRSWIKSTDAPFHMYFHSWELDKSQPRITAAGRLARLRHYRNLGKPSWLMEDYFRDYGFGPIKDFLVKNDPEIFAVADQRRAVSNQSESSTKSSIETDSRSVADVQVTPVSIVIPCFNEERGLPYLSNTLKHMQEVFEDSYAVSFIFVDDGSTDDTWNVLNQLFSDLPNYVLIQHEKNRGVAAAVMTGIDSADTDVVASMDCDCTYDPLIIKDMLPLLAEDVAMVTASPYHPDGKVQNVPEWRLFLSRGASFLYRRIIGGGLHTYTSCCRVYRRAAIESIDVKDEHFLGIAELLCKLLQRKKKIVEFPATLSVRIFGQSKMKTLKTIVGHLKLLWRLHQERPR